MMSLATIQEMSREQAARAFEEGNKPMSITENEWKIDVQDAREGHIPSTLRTIPNLGDPDIVIKQYPGEYELVESLFVDKGNGLTDLWDAGGPSLSIGAFAVEGLRLTQEHGTLFWLLGNEGQFQMYAFALRKING